MQSSESISTVVTEAGCKAGRDKIPESLAHEGDSGKDAFICPNCAKIAMAVRDWGAFTKSGEPMRVPIAPFQAFKTTAKQCLTCHKLNAAYFSQCMTPFEDQCVVEIRPAIHDSEWDKLRISSVSNWRGISK